MIRAAFLLLLAPIAAEAQLELFLVNGTQTTPITAGSTFSLGQIAAGASENFVIQVLNSGTAPVPIVGVPALSGTGFAITSPQVPPPNIAPGNSLNIFITFSEGPAGGYSASFRINTTSVVFVITVVPTATLTVASPCTGPDSTHAVGFGNISVTQRVTCSFLLQNLSSQALTVSTVAVAGTGFLLTPPATPLNLPAGVASQFTIQFAPSTATSYSGKLVVDTQTFTLTGTAYNPPLPTPLLQFDTNTPQSGQQITLTMTLPTPSPITTSGSVNLAFQPDASVVAIAPNDPAVNFVSSGARSVPFTIQQGSKQAIFNAQPSAVFQTGTTTGKITFTVSTSAQLDGDPTVSLTLPPTPMSIDKAAATSIAGALRIQVWGFDNTYSAGPMSFTFLDGSGHSIGSGAVTADFTSNFRTYFTTSADGSAFQMLVTFPVTGNAAEVGSVNVQLTNSAGASTIQNLAFLNDTGTCVLINNVLTCPPAPSQ